MIYCTQCGSKLIWQIPECEDRPRHVCEGCGTIHYENPKMVAGTIPESDGKILLCRRAIEPKKGLWTLPAGYLENGESVADCAVRESFEEARVKLGNLEPYTLCNLPFINQVYFFYRAPLINDDFEAGPESLEVELFSMDTIPWQNLAFTVVYEVLRKYRQDQENNLFPFRVLDIHQPESR